MWSPQDLIPPKMMAEFLEDPYEARAHSGVCSMPSDRRDLGDERVRHSGCRDELHG
jgi:hypothetical protein